MGGWVGQNNKSCPCCCLSPVTYPVDVSDMHTESVMYMLTASTMDGTVALTQPFRVPHKVSVYAVESAVAA